MTHFGLETWLALGALSAAGVTAVLSTLARYMQHERELQNLRSEVRSVRAGYQQRLAEIAARENGAVLEVSPVEEIGAGGVGGVAGTIGMNGLETRKAA